MFQLPNLNDQNFESIMEMAMKQIKTYGDEWIDLDIHDPGVTFLELFAYLKELQQAKINKVGEKSLHKFLTLLHIKREWAKSASTIATIKVPKNLFIPKGTKFCAFDIIFETRERLFLIDNAVTALGTMNENRFILQDYHEEDTSRYIAVFGDKELFRKDFYIIFEKALPENEIVSYYMELSKETDKRNPVTNPNTFIPLSTIVWEYYGLEEEKYDWHEIQVIKDETWGFLFSGQIQIRLKGSHKKICISENNIYCIRARVLEYGYEKPPFLQTIRLNSLKLYQENTKCETISFTYKQFKENKMIFDSYLAAIKGTNRLFIKEGNGFLEAKELGILFLVKPIDNMLFRLGTSDRERLAFYFEDMQEEDIVFELIICDKDFHTIIGSGDGIAERVYKIKKEAENEVILYDEFELMVQGKEGKGQKWILWNKTNSFDGIRSDEKKYVLNPEKFAVKFGNNINGKVPSKGIDNIIVRSLKTTQGIYGNIQKGLIEAISDETLFPDILIFQFCEALGGKTTDSVSELLEKALYVIEQSRFHAVTIEDYKRFVFETQGILVKNVTVIPFYSPLAEKSPFKKTENMMTVVVEPYTGNRQWKNLDHYLENIKLQLETVRLITTKVDVILPQYLPLDLYGELVVKMEYSEMESFFNETFHDYIDKVQKDQLGFILYHSDLCNMLEELKEVIQVNYLKLDLAGNTINYNHFGDVEVPPCTKLYLRNTYITIEYR